MNLSSVFRVPCSVLLLLLLAAVPVFADSKAENSKPLDPPAEMSKAAVTTNVPASPELEQKYRAELEKRLEQERASYEGSLTSLWLSNAAVWGCLLVFIAVQALSARKKAAELARLKAERESKAG